jgi:hypothetical protein
MLLRWLERRKAAHRLIKSDAGDLIARYGDDAYGVARQRLHDEGAPVISEGRSKDHWAQVMVEIARLSDRPARVDTATRYLDCE